MEGFAVGNRSLGRRTVGSNPSPRWIAAVRPSTKSLSSTHWKPCPSAGKQCSPVCGLSLGYRMPTGRQRVFSAYCKRHLECPGRQKGRQVDWDGDGSVTVVQAETRLLAGRWLAAQGAKHCDDSLIVAPTEGALPGVQFHRFRTQVSRTR